MGVVNWWEESQLRILVLSSLVIQCLLAIFAGGRRFSVPRWYRFIIWILYIASDAVANYALATLFNRQSKLDYKFPQENHDLEVFWAPILLVHLGGQLTITAYNLEDNELWTRHIVTTISQVTVAVYVFWKSWSPLADRKLLGASVILFISGTAKCIEKAVSLRGASFNKLATDSSPPQGTPTKNREEEVENYVQKARKFILDGNRPSPSEDEMEEILCRKILVVPNKLFTDNSYPYSDRMDILKSFFVLDEEKSYESLRTGISNIFSILYTKVDAYAGVVGQEKLDLVAQHSIIRFLSREEWQSSFMKPCNASTKITDVIHQYVINGWKKCITDAESYHKFSDRRGHWKLEEEKFGELDWRLEKPFDESVLLWHLATDLCWHDIMRNEKHACYIVGQRCRQISGYMMHLLFANPEMLMMGSRRNLFKTACDQIEDLLGTSRKTSLLHETKLRTMFETTCDKIEDFLETSRKTSLLHEEELIDTILENVKGAEEAVDSSFINDASVLSQKLKKKSAGDERKMWEVIEGVWVEMICFSASRCRGYLHAKNLGSGVEYLSYVWLLLSHLGMETLPERLQRSKLSRKKKTKLTPSRGEDPSSASEDTTVVNNPVSSQVAPVLDEIVVSP